MAPDSEYSDYFLFKSGDSFYLLLNNPRLGEFYIYAGDSHIIYGSYEFYKYTPGSSNNWELCTDYKKRLGTFPQFPGLVVCDATKNVCRYGAGVPIYNASNKLKTGYRIYWQLAVMLRMVLARLDSFCDLILEHELIRYAALIGFGGEIVFFVVTLIRRIGELRYAEIE